LWEKGYEKTFLVSMFATKGAFAIVCILSLLSLASASVASSEEVLTGCFHKEINTHSKFF